MTRSYSTMTWLSCVPISLGILFPLTCICTYFASVFLQHVNTGLAYISDVGSHPPESCYFGQFVNIGAAMMAIIVYIRHHQLMAQDPPHRPPLMLLHAGLFTGWISALGVSIVANFQIKQVPSVHYLGALIAFGSGVPFYWIQTKCTAYDPPEKYSKTFLYLRCFLATISSVFCALSFIGINMSHISRDGAVRSEDNYHVGLEWFITATICEWLMGISMSAYIITFAREFQYINVFIVIQQVEDEIPVEINEKCALSHQIENTPLSYTNV